MGKTAHVSQYLRQQKPEKEEEQEVGPSKKDRPLHSMYHCKIEKVADIK